MFTGIISELGTVSKLHRATAATEILLELKSGGKKSFHDVVLGESIAVNGVCLTVAEPFTPGSETFSFYVSPETLEKTQFSQLTIGDRVNLERSLRASERLSGHIVQGHVDGIAFIESIDKRGEAYSVKFRLPETLSKYCIVKGSICLNGVSLTINEIEGSLISIMMIPHTWEHTQFHQSRVKDSVNLEVDVLAKYVEKLCLQRP